MDSLGQGLSYGGGPHPCAPPGAELGGFQNFEKFSLFELYTSNESLGQGLSDGEGPRPFPASEAE